MVDRADDLDELSRQPHLPPRPRARRCRSNRHRWPGADRRERRSDRRGSAYPRSAGSAARSAQGSRVRSAPARRPVRKVVGTAPRRSARSRCRARRVHRTGKPDAKRRLRSRTRRTISSTVMPFVPASIPGLPLTSNSRSQECPSGLPDTSTATDADALPPWPTSNAWGTGRCPRRHRQRSFGQQDVIDQTLVSLLSGGHLLLIGVPGLAKTKLVETPGHRLGHGCQAHPVHPDLMPADILGPRSWKRPMPAALLPLHPGPGVRPAPDGRRDQLRQPAHPVGAVAEHAGKSTSPWPASATTCREPFHGWHPESARAGRHLSAAGSPAGSLLLQVDVAILTKAGTSDHDRHHRRQCADHLAGADAGRLMAAQTLVRRLPIGESVVDAILKLVRAGRPDRATSTSCASASPGDRPARQPGLHAGLPRRHHQGRLAPSVDDVVALAGPILRHRMAVEFLGARRGHHGQDGDRPDVRPPGVKWLPPQPSTVRWSSPERCPP